ncbi:MAG: phosphonopyruvate decarboxylase [Candidatus Competibacteraceae bacterium]|nr:phosphonopyruvate decarboxylase [Candidatus Competibacteraceae bacterium]
MIQPNEFITLLEKLDIRFVTGVPDSLLKDVCACITSYMPVDLHIIATNEGSAVGLAIGHYLATGRPALVYLQNAGLGNVVNPVASLADPQVYAVPMVFMIGWRGEILADGGQLHDEPQHVKQGQITTLQLEILGIPYRVIDGMTIDIKPALENLISLAMARSGPVALLVRKHSFEPFKLTKLQGDHDLMSRETAIETVLEVLPDNLPIVSTTGMASRELFEIRKISGSGHHRDFLTVGGMGHASQIAAGIALAKPNKKVVCLDGDGALLMHMGGLTISADRNNLLHIVINNGAHDSVGGQPTKAEVLDLKRIASACGYGVVALAIDQEEIRSNVRTMLDAGCSAFLEIKCRRGARADLGRPDRTPVANKIDFMNFLQDRAGE